MRVLYLISCVLMIISLTGCASSCTKAQAELGPGGPTVCFDKQWSYNIELVSEVRLKTGERDPYSGEEQTNFGLPKDTPIYDMPAASCSLYAYPSSLVTSCFGTSKMYLTPLPAERIRSEGYFHRGLVSIEALLEGEVRVGGSTQEPKMAMKYMIRIPDGKIPSSGLFMLEQMTQGSAIALVRLK